MIGSLAVQTAVYDALIAASVAGGRVHDDVPQDVAFPYVAIDASQVIADDVTCADGSDEFVDLHIWSRYRGWKEVKEIADAIHGALHAVSLTAAGRTTTHAFVQSFRTLRDPDGVTRHGVITLRISHAE